MKVLFKKILSYILDIYLSFFKIQSININDDLIVVVLLRKPLGIGDIVMLSPFILKLEEKFNKIYLVTEYEPFLIFKRSIYIHPDKLCSDILAKALVISPSFTFYHFKYIFLGKYFLGYFTSNKLVSNIGKMSYRYNVKKDHYLEKTFCILKSLKVDFDTKNFIYPLCKIDKIAIDDIPYIAIAAFSNWKERQYPLNKYVHLIKQLLDFFEGNILLLGSNSLEEKKFNEELYNKTKNKKVKNLCGETSLLEMNYLIQNSILFIGNDSGPAHIAYICAKRVLVFFGSVPYECRLPLSEILLKKILPLDSRNKCPFFPCYNGFEKPICKNNDKYVCIKQIDITTSQIKTLLYG